MLGRVSLDSGRVLLDHMEISNSEFPNLTKVHIAACGTSWHPAQTGKFMIEQLASMQVEVNYAREFRYRDPIVTPTTLTMLITQSGETADTIAARREAKSRARKRWPSVTWSAPW